MSKIEKYYDGKGNAEHYSDRINLFHICETIWGTKNTMIHFEMMVMKYRYRLGKKNPDLIQQEVLKIQWYERAIKFLKGKIESGTAIKGLGDGELNVPTEISKKFK